jgi:hypothetical protein
VRVELDVEPGEPPQRLGGVVAQLAGVASLAPYLFALAVVLVAVELAANAAAT